MPTEQRLSVRVPARHRNLKARLANAAKISGVIESEIVIAAVSAACDFIEKYKQVVLPMKFSTNALEDTMARVEKVIKDCAKELRRK